MYPMDMAKISAMREGGKILGEILAELRDYVDVGMTKRELDRWTRQKIESRGATCSYDELEEPFPGCICISVVIKYKGYHTDAAFTTIVGHANSAVKQMVKTTEAALWAGIDQVAPGVHLGDIGYAVEQVLRRGKLGVIENYIGHGIGKSMHMPPEVPNYGRRGHGYVLKPGDCICIEPMSSLGKPYNHVDQDSGWSVILSDGSIGCHCEHTILVPEDGHEVLTLPNCPRA